MGTHQLPVTSQTRDLRSDRDTGDTTIGTLLRTARESCGLTLQQIASETKIPRRHLEALERDELNALPAGLYLRGEIRVYARVVHLDENLVLARLERRLATSHPVPTASEAQPGPRPRVLTRERLLAGLGLVAIAAVVGFAVGRREPAPADAQPTIPGPSTDLEQRLQPVSQTQNTAIGTSLRASEGALPSTLPDAASAIAVTSGPAHDQQTLTTGDQPASDQELEAGAAAQASSAQLIVTTQPPGARVTVNGIGWGTTPVTIRYLPPGDKRIRVSQDGYAASELVVSLAEGQRRKLAIPMRPTP